jgi:hypothetical protein
MNTWLRLTLITMTVGAGFTGVALSLQALITSPNRGTKNLLLATLMLVLYTYVMAAGLVFAHSPRRTGPLFAALAMQAPWISSSLLLYKFAAGFEAFVRANYSQDAGVLTLNFDGFFFGSRSTVAILQQNPLGLGVNLWAAVLLILLWKSTWVVPAPMTQSVSTSAESTPVAG